MVFFAFLLALLLALLFCFAAFSVSFNLVAVLDIILLLLWCMHISLKDVESFPSIHSNSGGKYAAK